MNIRLFSIAVLMSALPLQSFAAGHEISLNHADFIAAEKVSPSGETVLNVKLSKSGKAKMKKLNASSVSKEVHVQVAGVASDFKLKVPIVGDEMQMGPFSIRLIRGWAVISLIKNLLTLRIKKELR